MSREKVGVEKAKLLEAARGAATQRGADDFTPLGRSNAGHTMLANIESSWLLYIFEEPSHSLELYLPVI